MWDDIPTDNETTTDEEPDSDSDAGNFEECDFVNESETGNTVPEIHSEELEDSIAQSESTAATSENASPPEGSKKKSTQIAAEKIATQIEKLEDMLSKTGGDAKKLTSEEVKRMLAALKKLETGLNNQLTVARTKPLLEIAQREWKKGDKPAQRTYL